MLKSIKLIQLKLERANINNIKTMTAEQWCIEQHKNTNHFYDKYLPYEFHLRMVVQVFKDFKHLLDGIFKDSKEVYKNMWEEEDVTLKVIELACWGHDLIEDTRTSYNDCKEKLKVGNYCYTEVADIIYAVSNEKGKTRAERANDKYYEGIVNTKGAVFVKLCDRIANVQYSKMTKSRMFEMYKQENFNFCEKLGYTHHHDYVKMFQYLINLFDNGI